MYSCQGIYGYVIFVKVSTFENCYQTIQITKILMLLNFFGLLKINQFVIRMVVKRDDITSLMTSHVSANIHLSLFNSNKTEINY